MQGITGDCRRLCAREKLNRPKVDVFLFPNVAGAVFGSESPGFESWWRPFFFGRKSVVWGIYWTNVLDFFPSPLNRGEMLHLDTFRRVVLLEHVREPSINYLWCIEELYFLMHCESTLRFHYYTHIHTYAHKSALTMWHLLGLPVPPNHLPFALFAGLPSIMSCAARQLVVVSFGTPTKTTIIFNFIHRSLI